MFKPKKAFTLIELLVAIAIIGILATVSIISLSNARAKSRDAKRAGDMKQVQTALELFFNDNNRYPTAEEFELGSIFSTSTAGTSTYLQIIPTAPTPVDGICTSNQNNFYYAQTDNGNSYTISFCLGNTTGTLVSGPKCLTPGGILNSACFECGVNTIIVSSLAGHVCNTGAPDYDQCVYGTVQIGTQCWIANNFNVGSIVTGATTQTDNSILEKHCYSNDFNNCLVNGGLYQRSEAMQYSVIEGAQGLCPSGWHLPSDTDWYVLENYLTDMGNTCDANRSGAWDCSSAATKLRTGGSSGFNGTFSGYRGSSGSFNGQGTYAYLWSSSPSLYSRYWYTGYSTVFRSTYPATYGLLARCVKD